MSEELSPGQEYAEWKAPETGETSPDTEIVPEQITDPAEIHRMLTEQHASNFLFLHQTRAETADQIVDKAEYFTTGTGIEGTVAFMDPDQIARVLPELDKEQQDRVLLTHKGADGAVIAVFPRAVIDHEIAEGSISKMQGPGTVDDILADKVGAGELAQIGLPNNFLYGSYHDAVLRLNPNYNPVFETDNDKT